MIEIIKKDIRSQNRNKERNVLDQMLSTNNNKSTDVEKKKDDQMEDITPV